MATEYINKGPIYLSQAQYDALTTKVLGQEYVITDFVAASSTDVATIYDTSKAYAVGDIVYHDEQLYKCTTAVTAGSAWDNTSWSAVTSLADEIVGKTVDPATTTTYGTLKLDTTAINSASTAKTDDPVLMTGKAIEDSMVWEKVADKDNAIQTYNATASKNDAIAAGTNATASGVDAIAIGHWSNATEDYSIAIGEGCAAAVSSTAIGCGYQASHPLDATNSVEWWAPIADGTASVAIGSGAKATNFSTAIGGEATGDGSIAIGSGYVAFDDTDINSYIKVDVSKASGGSAIAIGNNSSASGDSSISIGISAEANKNYSIAMGDTAHVESNESVAIGSEVYVGTSSPNSVVLGSYSAVDGNVKCGVSIGDSAFVSKDSNYGTAIGHNATVEVDSKGSIAFGTSATIRENSPRSIAIGTGARARNAGAIAIGTLFDEDDGITDNDGHVVNHSRVYANGVYSIALGYGCVCGETAESDADYAIAINGDACAKNAIAIGNGSTANEIGAISIGDSLAHGKNSVAIGYSVIPTWNGSGDDSQITVTTGEGAIALGGGCQATGKHSFATGFLTKASGDYAHAEGNGDGEMPNGIEGSYQIASGYASHVEGSGNIASGSSSHAEGKETKASGDNTHTEGCHTEATRKASHAEGYYTITKNLAEHAEGNGNISKKADDNFGNAGNTIHTVGIGSSVAGKNAHEIMQNGDMYIIGIGGYDGTNSDPTNLVKATDGTTDAINPLTGTTEKTVKTLQDVILLMQKKIEYLEGVISTITTVYNGAI